MKVQNPSGYLQDFPFLSVLLLFHYTGCLKSPKTVGYFSGKIFFLKVKVIPKVNFNEEFNGDLHFDLEVDLHGFFKVNFVFLNGNPLSSRLQPIERKYYVQVRTQVIGQL